MQFAELFVDPSITKMFQRNLHHKERIRWKISDRNNKYENFSTFSMAMADSNSQINKSDSWNNTNLTEQLQISKKKTNSFDEPKAMKINNITTNITNQIYQKCRSDSTSSGDHNSFHSCQGDFEISCKNNDSFNNEFTFIKKKTKILKSNEKKGFRKKGSKETQKIGHINESKFLKLSKEEILQNYENYSKKISNLSKLYNVFFLKNFLKKYLGF